MKENKKHKGSATVIVLVMFSITLIFAMATTYIAINQNKKASKIAEWNSTYYELDARAVKTQFKVKQALVKAEKKTIEYMYNKEYLKNESAYLPLYAQAKVLAYYQLDLNLDKKVNDIMKKVYLFYANAYLEDLINEVPELIILKIDDGALIHEIAVKSVFKDENGMQLEMTQEIRDIGYDVGVSKNNDIIYKKIRNKYTTTESYFISQPLVE